MTTAQRTKVLRVLKRTRRRLTPMGAWTQETDARDIRGTPVNPTSPVACCWCLIGAIAAETGDNDLLGLDVETAVCEALGRGVGLGVWNDARERKKADVLAALDAAIARVREGT